MLDLMLKLAKKKFGKTDVEEPTREYMRLELELEEICSLHGMTLKNLKSLKSLNSYSFYFGAEEEEKIVAHLNRMQELWDGFSVEDRMYLTPPDGKVENDELSRVFQEKEYLQLVSELESELESEANILYISYKELIDMDHSKLISLLGKWRASEISKKSSKVKEMWNGLTMEQKSRLPQKSR